MTRQNAYFGRMTDMLSAFLLLLAVLLAGGSGPQAAPAASAAAPSQAPTNLGSGGHRSVPFVSKQQLLASEAEDDKAAASWSDGKPQAFLPAQRLEIVGDPGGVAQPARAAVLLASAAASPYEARAPPAKS